MTLHLYDTATRMKREFQPADKDMVRVYGCGPTVYGRAHVGNFRSFLVYDLVHRVLAARGFRTVFVSNLTDVDDKTIRGAQSAGVSLGEFTRRHTEDFFADMAALGIRKAAAYPAATEYIKEMVSFVQKVMNKGAAYVAEDGSVYFRLSAFPAYGKLSGLDKALLRPGARILVDESKEEAADFALWKAAKPEDEKVGAAWDSPWGRGRPGWHLECSVMSTEILGPSLDLHLGGEDLKFPHHESEIAQSEIVTGQKFSRHWLHITHLTIDGNKMSKSLGNMYTLADLEQMGIPGSAMRMAMMSAHYRTPLNFTIDGMTAAGRAVEKLLHVTDRVSEAKSLPADEPGLLETLQEHARHMNKELDDDLNVSRALACVFAGAGAINQSIDTHGGLSRSGREAATAFLLNADEWLGVISLGASERRDRQNRLEGWAEPLVRQRQEAREQKNWPEADRIRKILDGGGVVIHDDPTTGKTTFTFRPVTAGRPASGENPQK